MEAFIISTSVVALVEMGDKTQLMSFLLAAVSGIADVYPINLTLSRMSIAELSLGIAVLGIVIASSSNMLVNAVLAIFVGGPGLGMRVLVPLSAVVGAGLATAWLL